MSKEDTSKQLIIYIYKIAVFAINYCIFAFIFSMINKELLSFSRISILTLFVYVLTLILLLPIFRSFDIGQRKSKPVIFSTAVVYLISLMAIYSVQIIMAVRLDYFNVILSRGGLLLIPIYSIQFLFLYIFSYLGNLLYFKLYKPYKTLILYDNEEHLGKIKDYITAHDKQYNLIDIKYSYDKFEIDYNYISIIFLVGINSKTRYDVQENCFIHSIDLYYTASVGDVISGKSKSTVIDDVLMIESPAIKLTLIQTFIKRAIDIVFSALLLFLSLPVFIIVAIAIKIDDGGKVFYVQERVTINNEVFKIIKFRSMKSNSGDIPATVGDDRITKIGHIIRKLRIDELPQLVNILKGDMSVVGPRPESKNIASKIEKNYPEFSYRLKVKAGLTGYAQIFGKYNTTSKQKLVLDLKYIVNYSVANDIKLILQTANVFFNPENSTEGFQPE